MQPRQIYYSKPVGYQKIQLGNQDFKSVGRRATEMGYQSH